MAKYAYMLRTCAADMTSHGGFVWPRKARRGAGLVPGVAYRLDNAGEFVAVDSRKERA